MSKIKEKWQAYVEQLPGMSARMPLPADEPDDESVDMAAVLGEMPTELADKAAAVKREAGDTSWERLIEHRWCLCEMAEGDFPRVFVFPSVQRMSEAIAKREGVETAVWPLFGVPLGISKPLNTNEGGVVRYLILPNGKAAVVSKDVKFEIIDQSLLPQNIEMQDEGWLGDPEYLEGKSYYEEGFIEADSFTNDPDMSDDSDDGPAPTET
jgi:hypothetical protein